MMNTSEEVDASPKTVRLLVPCSLRMVFETIDRMCKDDFPQALRSQFVHILQTLDYNERSLVADYFCKVLWNISSVKVLGCLHRLRILTATEYILSQTDDEHIQLVLNDFLETEFDLIANLIICGHYDLMSGSKIMEYTDESIRRLFADLEKDPKLNSFEYLAGLKERLPKELHTKLVHNHLKIILSMYSNSTQHAFANLSNWTAHNKNELISNFYEKGISSCDINIVQTFLNMSGDAQFKGWKNYLCLLAAITSNSPPQYSAHIKRCLKERLKTVAESGSTETMAHVLLSIRVVCLFQSDQAEDYAKWYKQNIGDMKFVFNSNEFKTMMNVLTNLVPFETDEKYLEVHIRTSISPPVMCSQICRDYKLLCRTRMADIMENSQFIELDDDLFPDNV